jgi:hypothetical protein
MKSLNHVKLSLQTSARKEQKIKIKKEKLKIGNSPPKNAIDNLQMITSPKFIILSFKNQ